MNKLKRIQFPPNPQQKYFYHYPRLICIVGVQSGEKVNFMPVAWNMPLSYIPFLYGISIGMNRSSHEMLHNSNSFSINLLSYKHLGLVRSLGRSTGKEIDKVKEFNVGFSPGVKTEAPLLDMAYCVFECEKEDAKQFGDHTLFVGKVVSIEIDEKCFDKENLLNINNLSPLIYLGVDRFVTLNNKSLVSLKDLPFHYKNTKDI